MGELTLTQHLKTCAELAKEFATTIVSQLAQSTVDAIEEIDSIKADKAKATTITIASTSSAWKDDDTSSYPIYYDISDDLVSESTRCMVLINPSDMDSAAKCGMCQTCETLDGIIRIRAMQIPSTEIEIEYWLDS